MLKKLFLLFCLTLPITAVAAAPQWIVDTDNSTLSFSGKQMGADFKGQFKKFTPVIFFDLDHLDQSKVTVDVDLTSIDTGDIQRDDAAKGRDWFDAKQFPTAHFESTTFNRATDGSFEALGNLTIHDITLPVRFPFNLVFPKTESVKQIAFMTGTLMLDRSKFQLGQGEWADPSAVANEITVEIKLTATRQ